MSDHIADLEAEHRSIRRQFHGAGVSLVVLLTVGVVFYHHVERLNYLDAVYFCVTTLATIGFGDITPKTNAGKLFTIFYAIIGIGIFAFFVNILVKNASVRRQLHQEKKRSS